MDIIQTRAFVTDIKFLKADENGIMQSIPSIERPARFWYGASLPFRIEESIHVINSRTLHCTFYEALGILYDIQLVLDEANENIGCVDRYSLAKLQQAFDDLSQSIRHTSKDYLMAAALTQPDQPRTDRTVQVWYDAINQFLDLSHGFASAWNEERLWTALRERVYQRYQDYISQVIANGAIVDPDGVIGCEHVEPSAAVLNFEKPKPCLTEESTADEVLSAFNSVLEFYRYWSRQDASTVTIAAIRVHFKALKDTIKALFIRTSKSGSTLKSDFLSARDELIYSGWCSHFRHVFEDCIQEDFVSRQSRLRAAIHDNKDMELTERTLFLLASQLRDAAFIKPEKVCKGAWSIWAPCVLPSKKYDVLTSELQQIANDLQHRLSASCEIKSLWFDLYRSLITTYLILRQAEFVFPDIQFPLEKEFFGDLPRRAQFMTITSEPMILNPTLVENIVAEYCTAIAEARLGSDIHHDNIRRYSENAIRQTDKNVNKDYHQNEQWKPLAIRVMQKMAVRLNCLTGGPGFIRRAHHEISYWEVNHVELSVSPMLPEPSSADSDTALDDYSHEDLVKLMSEYFPTFDVGRDPARIQFGNALSHLNGEAPKGLDGSLLPDLPSVIRTLPLAGSLSTAEIAPRTVNPPASTLFEGSGATSSFQAWGGAFASPGLPKVESSDYPNSIPSQSTSDGFPEPLGINHVSSFDYVNCPFPETRAVEVALSRQISRELSDTSIVSTGPRVEDVVNQPPRHTRTPGQISVLGKYLPYGPWDLLKALWQKPEQLKPAKQRKSITSRLPRKSFRGKHDDPLSPQKDSHRIAKSSSSQSRIPRVPKLRGGGGSLRFDPESLVQSLLDRTSDILGPHNAPTPPQLIAEFLEPANWDVNVAAENLRRVFNVQREWIPRQDRSSVQDAHQRLHAAVSRRQIDERGFETGNVFDQRTTPPAVVNAGPSTGITPLNMSTQASNDLAPLHVIPSSIGSQSLPPNPFMSAYPPDAYTNISALTTGNAQNLNPYQAEGFNVFIDPNSQPSVPPPFFQPNNTPPAGNQVHEAQRQAERERAQQGLPPRRTSDFSSGQENRDPRPALKSLPLDSSNSDDDSTPRPPRCLAIMCHRCPIFQSQYHHVCPGQPTQRPISLPDRPLSPDIPFPSIEFSGSFHSSFSVGLPESPSYGSSSSNNGGDEDDQTRASAKPVRADEQQDRDPLATSAVAPTTTRSKSEIPDSQHCGVILVAQPNSSTTAQPTTSANIGTTRGRGGNRSRGTRNIPASTRVTRRTLAQINAQQPPNSPLKLDEIQAQGGSQVFLSSRRTSNIVGQITRGPAIGHQPAHTGSQRVNSSNQGNRARGRARGRGRGRVGVQSVTDRGSPLSRIPGTDRADLTDPTAYRSPSPPSPPNPHRGQIDTARHPHWSSDEEFSGEETTPSDVDFSPGPYVPNFIRPAIPEAFRSTRSGANGQPDADLFVSSAQPYPTSARVAPWPGPSRAPVLNSDLPSTAAAALRMMDTQALSAGVMLPNYGDGRASALESLRADETAGRPNSERVQRRSAIAPHATDGNRGLSERVTRGEKRNGPQDIDADLKRNQRRRK